MENRTSRRQRQAPTISDVARQAGVSAMTVSRVINGEKTVRPATREKVEQAIAALGYSPSAAARSLAGGVETRIGLLYSNPSASYLSEFLVGSLDQASRCNVDLIVKRWDETLSVEVAVERLLETRIDGVVLPPPLCDMPEMIEALKAADTIAVAVATGRVQHEMSVVSIDDHDAACDMTRHLLALGHKRIGFIAGNSNQSASQLRLDGYLHAMAETGGVPDRRLVAQGDFTYRSGLEAAERLLNMAQPPSAIFAANDEMAAAAVAVAHRRGLHVPADVGIVGFDDTSLATTIWPELTTIHQPISEMSRTAVDLLVREIRHRRAKGRRSAAVRVQLDHELIRRESDGPPRHR